MAEPAAKYEARLVVRCCTSKYIGVMSTTMTVSEARAALPEILDRVSAGDEVTLTRHGQPVAVIVRPDTLRARRADEAFATAATVRDLLERGRRAPLNDRPQLSRARADELIAEVSAGRDAR